MLILLSLSAGPFVRTTHRSVICWAHKQHRVNFLLGENPLRLDRKDVIAGQPIKRVREFLRTYRDGRPDLDSIAEFFGTKPDVAMVISAAMIERGLIAPAHPKNGTRDRRSIRSPIWEFDLRPLGC